MTDQFRPDDDDQFSGYEDLNSFGDTGFDDPTFPDPTAEDLPEDVALVAPQRNRTFILGLLLLIVLLVIGLGVILYAASNSGVDNANRRATIVAIEGTNNAVLTQIAATKTAKSWTLTPSNTPQPTSTSTFTPSPSNTPITPTLTPTVVPTTAAPTDTPKPGETLPTSTTEPSSTPTAPPTVEGVVSNPQVDIINTQNAQLHAGQTAFAVQETLNAVRIDPASTERAQKTQNAQFQAAQTAISVQLTANAATLTAISPGGGQSSPGSSSGSGSNSGGSLTPSPSATFEGTAVGSNRQQSGIVAVRYAREPNRPAAQRATVTPTLGPDDITATAAFIISQSDQLISAQTALAAQLTANAVIAVESGTPAPFLTQNAQIRLGQTAIAVQLTANANALLQKTPLPTTGLYEDLASGNVAPASLALIGVAALGLVGVIVAARRLRVKV